VAADLTASVKPPLDHRLRADEDGVAAFNRLRMLHDHIRTYLKAMARAFAQRTQNDAPHEQMKGALSLGKTGKQIQQLFAGL
jgi:hypothetical protein